MTRERALTILREHEAELKSKGIAHLRLSGLSHGTRRRTSGMWMFSRTSILLSQPRDNASADCNSIFLRCSARTSIYPPNVGLRSRSVFARRERQCLSSKGTRQHLQDILEATGQTNLFLEGFDFPMYARDGRTQSAVERQLLVVSEASYRLGREAHALAPGPDWSDLCGLGNVLRHGYHKIDDEIIWTKATVVMPEVKRYVEDALTHLLPGA